MKRTILFLSLLLVFSCKEKSANEQPSEQVVTLDPEINLTDDANSHEEIKTIVTTKSIEWKYENEYREVFIAKNMLYEYPGELTEIIFGCRAPYEDIKMVTDIAVSKNKEIKISKMIISKSEYNFVNRLQYSCMLILITTFTTAKHTFLVIILFLHYCNYWRFI